MSKNHSLLEKEAIVRMLTERKLKIHFIGVGGVGMYSLFMLSKELCHDVSGSDASEGELFLRLLRSGENVWCGSRPQALEETQLGVYSLAVCEEDRELVYLASRGVPLISRAELLGAILQLYSLKIGVSGSHGKSTTVSMLYEIFKHSGRSSTVVCGAKLQCGEPLVIGKKEEIIYEACEYKNSFLKLEPTLSVFLNLEHDHVDFFSSLDMLEDSFSKAYDLAKTVFINADDDKLLKISENKEHKPITFGLSENADFRAINLSYNGSGYSFDLVYSGVVYGFSLQVPGRFNVYNALAAISVAVTLGIPINEVREALPAFSGIERRLEYIGKTEGASFFYDYAHHPTEIEAGIKAVKEAKGAPVCVFFRPHTYSRTLGLFDEFCRALSLADRVYLLEIEGIREKNSEGISSFSLAEGIGKSASFISESELSSFDFNSLCGSVIVMGAADMSFVLSNLKFTDKT